MHAVDSMPLGSGGTAPRPLLMGEVHASTAEIPARILSEFEAPTLCMTDG